MQERESIKSPKEKGQVGKPGIPDKPLTWVLKRKMCRIPRDGK